MDGVKVDELVEKLSAGFDALQVEYQKLFGQHSALERKLATAREQYNELAKLYGATQVATPPLSLSSSHGLGREDVFVPTKAADLLDKSDDRKTKEAASLVRAANIAANRWKTGPPIPRDGTTQGVKIWSGPSADTVERANSRMPSISESPLEQDFTVEGKPSKLGCPFASMANKKLGSHAASVLSKYNQTSSTGAQGSVAGSSAPLDSTSRIDGRQSFSRRHSRRTSIVDPIKAEICGLSSHDTPEQEPSPPPPIEQPANPPHPEVENAEVGVCPIRFLDQHSPEEVATYFEKHKHELPRSHEVCVMRYRSNDEQIKELDAKYGNLVSMIAGLGQKHKDMLPEEPDEEAEMLHPEEALDDAKVRKWASSVSAQAPERGGEDLEGQEEEDRVQHFERPLRDVRVGESPSRPWGIQVPMDYLEKDSGKDEKDGSEASSPVRVAVADERPGATRQETAIKRPAGKCPFSGLATTSKPAEHDKIPASMPAPAGAAIKDEAAPKKPQTVDQQPKMVFTGPVFIGYSAEDAARILSGWQESNEEAKK